MEEEEEEEANGHKAFHFILRLSTGFNVKLGGFRV